MECWGWQSVPVGGGERALSAGNRSDPLTTRIVFTRPGFVSQRILAGLTSDQAAVIVVIASSALKRPCPRSWNELADPGELFNEPWRPWPTQARSNSSTQAVTPAGALWRIVAH